jgi:crotonobetainyl-CoA:carnitine CoA-transferase CaiB-like acyl-CoA transferase
MHRRGLYESAFSLVESHVASYQMLGKVAMRAGWRLPSSTPNSLYAVQDGYIAMTAASDSVFSAARRGHEAAAARRGSPICDGPGA